MHIKRHYIILVFANILMMIYAFFEPHTFFIMATLCIWFDLIVYCLLDFSNRVFLFTFLVAFFVFLMGREILDVFNLHTVVSVFKLEINIYAEQLLLLSLISLIIGYFVSNHIKVKVSVFHKKQIEYENSLIISIRKVSSLLFYFSLLLSVVQLLDIGRYMIRHGYLATYTSYTSGLPYLLVKLADITPISFWIYLSTMPSKKAVDIHSKIFAFYLAMTLLTGKRFAFVAGLLVLFAYYIMRNTIKSEGERWIKRSTIIICILSIPVAAVALYFFNTLRFGNSVDGISIRDAFTDFFYSQGVSINVIKYADMYELNPDKKYMFSSTLTFLQKNIIARILGVESYSGNTVENALYGNSMAHAMSYLLYGNRYLNGRGIGSCYIAEAFHDFGYIGVIVINFIYGAIIRRFFDFHKKGVFTGAISLILLNSLLYAPRGSADGFVADMVDFTTWGSIIFVYIVANLLSRKKRKKQ